MGEMNTKPIDRALTLLRRLSPRERLHVIAQVLPEAERELEAPTSPVPPHERDADTLATAEAKFRQQLVEMGLLAEGKAPLAPEERKLPEPIEVPGTPLSELIIAERR